MEDWQRFEHKLDKIVEIQHSQDLTLAQLRKDVDYHIRRTDIQEEKAAVLEAQMRHLHDCIHKVGKAHEVTAAQHKTALSVIKWVFTPAGLLGLGLGIINLLEKIS